MPRELSYREVSTIRSRELIAFTDRLKQEYAHLMETSLLLRRESQELSEESQILRRTRSELVLRVDAAEVFLEQSNDLWLEHHPA